MEQVLLTTKKRSHFLLLPLILMYRLVASLVDCVIPAGLRTVHFGSCLSSPANGSRIGTVFAFIAFVMLFASPSLAAQLMLEKVDDKYAYAYVELEDGVNLTFRQDRIEIISRGKQAQSTYQALLLVGSNRLDFKPSAVITTQSKPIPNPAMAEVLKADMMEVMEVGHFLYEDIYNGVDLKVMYDKGEVVLHFSANDAKALSQVRFSGAYGNTLVAYGASASLKTNFTTVDLTPKEGSIVADKNGGFRLPKSKKSDFSLSLSLR